jgi:ribulose-phosphate 3-epimerase
MGWDCWIRKVEVEPSLYAADFARLGEQVEAMLHAGARIFHFDIGDGHFVDPITMGPVVLQSISPIIHREGAVIDCHLMVDEPEHHFEALQGAGADSVTFHFEVAPDPGGLAARARARGFQVGLAFNPETRVEDVVPAAEGFDLVLCMSIHPGYSGQEFRPDAIGRLQDLRGQLPESVHVQVDGGITGDNIRAVHDAGADLIVCGSAIFGTDDPPGEYRRLVELLA